MTPAAPVTVSATLRDDYGLTPSRVLIGVGTDGPLSPVATATYPAGTTAVDCSAVLDLKPEVRQHGDSSACR